MEPDKTRMKIYSVKTEEYIEKLLSADDTEEPDLCNEKSEFLSESNTGEPELCNEKSESLSKNETGEIELCNKKSHLTTLAESEWTDEDQGIEEDLLLKGTPFLTYIYYHSGRVKSSKQR